MSKIGHGGLEVDQQPLTLGVLGLGHVGLPTALGLAELGWTVVGADDDNDKVEAIGKGNIPFHEPGLDEALRKHLGTGGFRVASSVPSAVGQSDILFVCVGTPQREDGSADLSQMEQVARTIARNLNGYKLIVEKSTTPVRTAEQLKRTIARYASGQFEFEVAVNPEFLREGTALNDFLNPDRVVLGVESERAREWLSRVYLPLFGSTEETADSEVSDNLSVITSFDRMVITDLNTAELVKHAANAFLAMKISFIDLVADLCEATGADVVEVARGLGMDPRIAPQFLQSGIGFGGYCLPKDLKAFIHIGEFHGLDMGLLQAVEAINANRIEVLLAKVRRVLWVLQGKTVAIWGLAFKPGTDDIREAPSLKVVSRLLEEGALLRLYDPQAMNEFQRYFPEISPGLIYCASPEETVLGSEALLVLTEWPEFTSIDLALLKDTMALPVIVDGRNCLDREEATRLGFEYYGTGR